MVIWITGLSASGKTTLSKAFEKKYKGEIPNMVLIDGDVIRVMYDNDLGYFESDRKIQINRIQKIAKFLEQQDILVIVAALYSNKSLLAKNRTLFKQYFEVYLKGDINLLSEREFKDLYKLAIEKKIQNVVGVDIPYFEPDNPDLLFEISENWTPDKMAEIIYGKIFKKNY